MSFNSYGVNQSSGSGNKKEVDFDALNRYVVEAAGLQQRETLVGVCSGIYDLGLQERADAELVHDGKESEADVIARSPNTYFKDGVDEKGNKARMMCYPQKPIQMVALSVDFPDIIVDKGQFFGNSQPLPLRLYLGGQFYIQDVGMLVQRPTELKISKSTGVWSFDKKHLLHKMAVAAKLIAPDEAFLPQQIDQLLGKAFQFEAQVFMKKAKNGKEYFTEYVKFVSGLGRGQATPELPFEPLLIQFDADNKDEDVKDLRAHIVNTMKRANNYAGSKIKAQIERVRGNTSQNASGEAQAPAKPQANADVPAKVKAAAKAAPVAQDDEFDTDVPF